MTKEQLRKFIKDTKGLIHGASNHQKVKLLNLIKEANAKLEEESLQEPVQPECQPEVSVSNPDYLDEK
jgi:hypothetical protein